MTTVILPGELRDDDTDDAVRSGRAAPVSEEQLVAAAAVLVAMTVIATTGFGTVFSTNSYLIVSLAGAALGALVVLAGRRIGLLFGEILGIGLIAPLLIGPLAAGGTGFYRGLVRGWAEILTATPPVDPTPGLKALPFIAAFVGALFGTELFRIRELPGLAIVGPLATLTLTALFSAQTRTGALFVGLVLLVGLLVLARLHYASVSTAGLFVLALVIGLVVATASAATLALPFADEERRFDLRDFQVPPWEPLSVPSPLSDLKAGLLQAGDDEVPILRVRGDVAVGRWRMASLPAYNGVFWSVAETNETADFVAVDTVLPEIGGERYQGDELQFDVDILAPSGTWLPTAGVPTRVVFSDLTDARMSVETGTIGVPAQLQPGNSYQLTVTPWAELDDAALANHSFVADEVAAELELLPPLVRNLAADFSTGLEQLSGQRILTIRDNLRLGSYELQLPPGHNFGRIGSFLQVVEVRSGRGDEGALRPLVGFEELYTASGAIMSRLSDIPTRVAVGYVVPPERWVDRSAEIFASDINAWIEVHIEGQGWMPVDVSPDRDRQPEEVENDIETAGAPFAEPPKTPPLPEEETPPEVEEPEEEPEEEEEEEPEDEITATVFGVARAIVAGISTILLVVLLIGAAVVGYKMWRRRRRRSATLPEERIAGAWAELVDRVDEAGGGLPARATPSEAAQYAQSIDALSAPEALARVEHLADQVSAAAFHPIAPTTASADAAWETYDELVASMRDDAGAIGRVRRALDPRTLGSESMAGSR